MYTESFGLGLTSLLNIWSHIATVPACSSDTLTNVLPHRNTMLQTQDMIPHPVTVYRRRANLSLCYPLIWNVTLEYTTTHINVLVETRPGNLSQPSMHTSERSTDSDMVVACRKLSKKYRTNRFLNPGPVVCESITLSARPQLLLYRIYNFFNYILCTWRALKQFNVCAWTYLFFYYVKTSKTHSLFNCNYIC